MKRRAGGLLANPSDGLAQIGAQIDEDLRANTGLLSGGFDAAQSVIPQVAQQGMRDQINAVMPFAMGGMTVYHGSPHFFDRFDLSKIGSGEGAQAYGPGLYFADSPSVA